MGWHPHLAGVDTSLNKLVLDEAALILALLEHPSTDEQP